MNPFKRSNFSVTPQKAPVQEIGRIADRLDIAPSGNMRNFSTEAVGVAAVQLICKRYASLTDYIVDMNLYVEDAVNRRAQLVVFPAYTGLLAFSSLSQYQNTLPKLKIREETGMPDVENVNGALAYYSDYLLETFYATMSVLAARHQVYIMAGSTLCFVEENLRHRAFLFDDRGELIGFQDKVSLTPFERELRVEESAEIKVFETELGQISILIGDDAHYYETGRVAARLGSRLLLNPAAFSHEYTPVDAALGLNLRVQENKVYGIQSVLAGDTGLGLLLEGPCAIFAPNEIVRGKNGILERGSGRMSPDLLCRRLNLEKLGAIKNPYTQDKNTAFMDKYVDRLY